MVDEPVSAVVLAQVLEEPTVRIEATLKALAEEYARPGRGIDLRQVAGGWRLYTRGEYASYVERFVLDGQQIRLTQAALETLAVVAYKQPVTRSRVAAIRGVNCDGVIKTLVTRGLVEECGAQRRAAPTSTGRPSSSWRSSASTASRTCPRSRRSCPRTWTRSTLPNAEPAPSEEPEDTGPQRLQKVLAGAGIGSRRACEELIAAGRVTVDGRRATLGDRADPRRSVIHVDGERVVTDTRLVYLALNKPRGIVSTMADERGRPGIGELLGDTVPQRVYHVGRLDTDSEGLLLLTNDGDLAHRLTHPSYEVAKTYLAEVAGPLPRGVGRTLQTGGRAGGRPGEGGRVPAGRRDGADRAGGDHPARGSQAHRAADARRRRAPGVAAHPYPGRPGAPGRPEVGPVAPPHPGRGGRPLRRGRAPVS